MCEPTTALMIGSTAVSGIMSMQAQRQQANAIADSVETRQEQEQKASQQKAFERSRQARRERARVITQASSAGVTGSSVSQQLMDSRFQEGHDRSTIRGNRNMAMEANAQKGRSQLAQVGDPKHTLVQTGLNIGTTAAQDPLLFPDRNKSG